MSAHRSLQDIFLADDVPDLGNASVITVDRSPVYIGLISLGVETRTLARPPRVGAIVTLFFKTNGGNITLTVTGGFNEDGDTTFTFSDSGQFAMFVGCYDGSTYFWRKISDYSTASVTPTEAALLDGVTAGTGLASKVLTLDASNNVTIPVAGVIDERNAEVVITTNVIAATENGRTYYLALANGFTSTLPLPALGLKFRFIVQIAPTTAYIITTNAGANILYGMMEERAGGAGVAGSAQDTFNFVASNAILGDWVEFYSDGTSWFYHGMVNVAAGTTVAVS